MEMRRVVGMKDMEEYVYRGERKEEWEGREGREEEGEGKKASEARTWNGR